MSYRCDRCGKGKLYGLQHRHHRGVAGGQWKKRAPKTQKVRLPNLHAFRGFLGGQKGAWKLCTNCLRQVKSENAELVKKTEKNKVVTTDKEEKNTKAVSVSA